MAGIPVVEAFPAEAVAFQAAAAALVAGDLLHPGAVVGILSPLDAPETGAQSHRLAGAAHLERETSDLGLVCGADLDLQRGID